MAATYAEWKKLFSSIHYGESKGLKEVLEASTDPLSLLNVAETPAEAWKPLHLAASRGSLELCQILLDHGADPLILSGDSETTLMLGCTSGSGPLVSLLLQVAEKRLQEEQQTEKATSFLEYVNQSSPRNLFTALHYSASASSAEAVTALLDAGANPNCRSRDGSTPLHLCCRRSFSDVLVLRALLEHGADANATINVKQEEEPTVSLRSRRETYGYAPLHCVVNRSCSVEMARVLLQHGANLNPPVSQRLLVTHQDTSPVPSDSFSRVGTDNSAAAEDFLLEPEYTPTLAPTGGMISHTQEAEMRKFLIQCGGDPTARSSSVYGSLAHSAMGLDLRVELMENKALAGDELNNVGAVDGSTVVLTASQRSENITVMLFLQHSVDHNTDAMVL